MRGQTRDRWWKELFCRPLFRPPLEDRGQRDHIQQIGVHPLPERQGLVKLAGSYPSRAKRVAWSGQLKFGRRQRQQKRAHELAVSQPDTGMRIAALERQHIHENGPRAGKENVERGGVFQGPACGDGVAGHAQSEFGGGAPLGGGPLPWVADGIDAWMFQPKLARSDAGMIIRLAMRLEIKSPLCSSAFRSGDARNARVSFRPRGEFAARRNLCQPEFACWIAKGQFQAAVYGRSFQMSR